MDKVKAALNENPVLRWSIMLLVSFTMAANYYFYDALSPLKSVMQEHLHFSSTDYGFLMSAYSIPNVFLLMAVLGGIILDKMGIRLTGFVFVIFMVLGSLLTAYGGTDMYSNGGLGYGFMNSFLTQYSPELKMMSFGFFLFGLGAETSIVVISKIIVKWFKGKELALAMGINLALARLGTALAFNISPKLLEDDFWTKPVWFGAMLLLIGLLTFLVYMIYDIKIDKQLKADTTIDPEEDFHFKDVFALVKIPSFVYITLLCVTFYSAVFPFLKYSADMMQNKFGFSPETAGDITSILPYGTVIFTPIFGWICDKKGKSASLMLLGSALLILVHLTFTFTNITPYVPMFVLGVAFSLVPAAMWPSVAKIVDTKRIGTAYGFMFSVQNLGLWAFPLLIGYVLDKSNPGVTTETIANGSATYDYTNPILMLSFLGALGLFFAFMLIREDKRSHFGLDLPNQA